MPRPKSDLKLFNLDLGEEERRMLTALSEAWTEPGEIPSRAAACRRAIREAYRRLETVREKIHRNSC